MMKHYFIIFILIFGITLTTQYSSFALDYTLREHKIVEYLNGSELIELGKEFDLFLSKGSTVATGTYKGSFSITLVKLVVNGVYSGDEYLGDQFSFHFKAKENETEDEFLLTLNEPQNMDLLEIADNSSVSVLGYKVSLQDINFSIGKNSIRMKIVKI